MIVAGVRFHNQDKNYDFDAVGLDLKLGDIVIVETEIGTESGKIDSLEKKAEDGESSESLKPVLRVATSVDLEKIEKYEKKVEEAVTYCREAVSKLKLEMKLVDAHFAFDGSRVTFYFTADARIDFRELVKDLTRNFQKSVRLQQIGSRDAAAKIGDYGICGRKLCCSKFLKEFESITLDTARVQQMEHRGSDRLSGCCGRLMCCLSYEAKTYKKLTVTMPDMGEDVITKSGKGRVISRNILKQEVQVKLDKEDKRENFAISDINWRNKKVSQDNK
ncbi:MAG: stage 0 sporulation protein [Parcubacteria group bacterium]|nr:stage 0 sporulation protein [Parcubacteria group bacterium]